MACGQGSKRAIGVLELAGARDVMLQRKQQGAKVWRLGA